MREEVKLDLSKLLGFRLLVAVPDHASPRIEHAAKTGAKIGGGKFGSKIGAVKIGTKIGVGKIGTVER